MSKPSLVSPINLNFTVIIKSLSSTIQTFFTLLLPLVLKPFLFNSLLFCSFILLGFYRTFVSLFHLFSLEPKSCHVWKITLWFSKTLDFISTWKDINSLRNSAKASLATSQHFMHFWFLQNMVYLIKQINFGQIQILHQLLKMFPRLPMSLRLDSIHYCYMCVWSPQPENQNSAIY